MKSQWMLILGLLFALIIAVFAVINVDAVQVNYLFGSTSTPLILVIMISTLFGGLAVGSLGMIRVFMLQRKLKQLEKQLHDVVNHSLQATPEQEGQEEWKLDEPSLNENEQGSNK
ncbi:lipopolysaccharide assembly LapA domain-containing protein [Paenibacillus septentrionalis]|uniref:Lipopolysaccharide assembly LapA domain-containing protein n=1 Tax=Paenibacillus septentrionalis TaxID=429342 RepID=A0ABW1V713_9BACL